MRKLKKLAKTRVRQYVKLGGSSCPYCGFEDIEPTGDHDNPDSSSYTQDMRCLNAECGKTWIEVYMLSTIIEKE